MNKKTIAITISIIGFILIVLINGVLKNKSKSSIHSKEPEYYLKSPWVTSRVDWFFIPLPEKWDENTEELNKKKSDYLKISNEVKMYEMKLKDFFLLCIYMNAKAGIYENWDLDKSASSITNQVLYNLKCKDIALTKLSPMRNNLEVNYLATSNCDPYNYKAKLKGIRYESHILFVCTYFKADDPSLEEISNRILNGIENKYPNLSNLNE